jgi:DNA repair protein RadA/Sms
LSDGKSKNDFTNFVVTEDTTVENILALLETEKFDLIVVDSIQSVSSLQSKGYPGSISQVRISGALFTRLAKTTGIPIFIVGQINKGGNIAGPKILEHIVDCVLYMEGDQYNQYRILRSMKNRFGSTNEIGVFEMSRDGLREVGNPSLLFLESNSNSSGSAIGAVMQGSRVVFVEVQALVVDRESEAGPLRRVANGIRKPRLDMLCAVMSRKGGVFLGSKDVFVNVVGGLNVNDPAIDLAVCAAIKSSVGDMVIPRDMVYFGEVGLTGEVRGMWGIDSVVSEAKRAGYSSLIVGRTKVGSVDGIKIKKILRISSI